MTSDDYKIIGTLPNGAHKIKFTSNEFTGIIFSIGQVSFEERDSVMHMNFDYDVIENDKPYEKNLFDQAIGDLIIHLIEAGVIENSLVYTGGVDEN